MLVLTRKQGQSVVINHDTEIIYLGHDSLGNLRLGFVAPKAITIHRKEVYEQIKKENQDAAMPQGCDPQATILSEAIPNGLTYRLAPKPKPKHRPDPIIMQGPRVVKA